jgi:hypothetical protein
MNELVAQHKDAATLLIAALSIAFSFLFGFFKQWRHRICFEYDGKRSAAITALNDKFQREAETQFTSVQARILTGELVQEVYQSDEQRKYIRSLALKLEYRNQVIRLHSYLTSLSRLIEWAAWLEILLIVLALVTLWWHIPHFATATVFTIFVAAAITLLISTSLLFYCDGRFLTVTHKVLKPEIE